MFFSIIIPVLNEESAVNVLLQQLQSYREQGHEVIVVDGGSEDKTIAISKLLANKVIQSAPGRAVQMNKGAAQASGDVLWFLHADSIPSDEVFDRIRTICNSDEAIWGRFDISMS